MKKLILFFIFIALLGCKDDGDYVREGLSSIEDVKKFDKIFVDQKEHSVGKYGESLSPKLWYSTASCCDRYRVVMVFPYKDVNAKGEVDSLRFRFYVNELNHEENGKWISRTVGHLALTQWRQVNSVEDIFKMIEIEPGKI